METLPDAIHKAFSAFSTQHRAAYSSFCLVIPSPVHRPTLDQMDHEVALMKLVRERLSDLGVSIEVSEDYNLSGWRFEISYDAQPLDAAGWIAGQVAALHPQVERKIVKLIEYPVHRNENLHVPKCPSEAFDWKERHITMAVTDEARHHQLWGEVFQQLSERLRARWEEHSSVIWVLDRRGQAIFIHHHPEGLQEEARQWLKNSGFNGVDALAKKKSDCVLL